jgi:serine/threonine protein phosphatase PrpC
MPSSKPTPPTPRPRPARRGEEPGSAAISSSDKGNATSPPLHREGYGLSDVGRKRQANEDAYFLDDPLGLYVVADGMGGHAAGEIASHEAVETIYGMVKRGVGEVTELVDPLDEEDAQTACRLMESAVQGATYMVFSMAELDRGKSGMGTTISALLMLGDYAITAQVGDSRIYRINGETVEQLTEDHTLIAWQLKQGIITPQEAKRSPHRNVITRAVGNREYVQVDTGLVPLSPGDRLLLCSDGLHGYLRQADIAPIVALGAERAVKRFIELANERGGKDNITAILVEID